MKKFKYRLEPLLRVKAHIEKERQKEHAVAVHRVQTQQEYLAFLDATRESAIERQRQGQSEPVTVSAMQLLSYSRYYLKLKRDRIAGTELLRGLETEAEKKRQRLVEASRERKMHDKLKERQNAKFNQAVELILKKDNDEIAVNNFRRRKTST
jgi:flagellar protein FliJ